MIVLFAYTKDPAKRVVKFDLDADLQKELSTYLLAQVAAFDAGCEEVAFNANYKPDDHECHVISPFDDLDALSDKVAAPLTVDSVQHDEDLLESIKALFFGVPSDGGWTVYFQSFDRRRLISNKGFSIFHSNDVYKKIEGSGLTIDTRIAAKLDGDKLIFKSFHYARQIFDLTSYYQEATDADIKDFAEIAAVTVGKVDSLKQNGDTWVRRKLWLIQQSKILDIVSPADLKEAAANFKMEINYEKAADGVERLVIPENKRELKNLLRFLDEDFYTSPILKSNYRTNSKVPLVI